MRRLPIALLIAALLAAPSCRRTVRGFEPDPRNPWPQVAPEIHEMAQTDQAIRQELIEWMQANPGQQPDPAMAFKMIGADQKHTKRLKEIVDEHGWPRISEAGHETAHDAWLIAQHAVHDQPFMETVLAAMGDYLDDDDVLKGDYALLKDRVLVHQGKNQIYGTQYKSVDRDGRQVMVLSTPVDDPENLDARRLKMGLGTSAEYVKVLEEAYGGQVAE